MEKENTSVSCKKFLFVALRQHGERTGLRISLQGLDPKVASRYLKLGGRFRDEEVRAPCREEMRLTRRNDNG